MVSPYESCETELIYFLSPNFLTLTNRLCFTLHPKESARYRASVSNVLWRARCLLLMVLSKTLLSIKTCSVKLETDVSRLYDWPQLSTGMKTTSHVCRFVAYCNKMTLTERTIRVSHVKNSLSFHYTHLKNKKTPITTPNHPSDFTPTITVITLLRLVLCVGAFHELIEQCLFFSFGVMNISGNLMGF